MNHLEKIVEKKKSEITKLKKLIPENHFSHLFNAKPKQVRIIAEIKHKSPSQGKLFSGKALRIVDEYKHGGVDALSVVTEKSFFGGSESEFRQVRTSTELPILKKDFVVSPIQLIEASQLGADAVLLIARIVDDKTLSFFVELSRDFGMEPVVEIFSKKETHKALSSGARFIAVNVRDLETGRLDGDRALSILGQLPEDRIKLLFSGIQTAQDIKLAEQAGANGVLIGTSLLKANNRVEAIRSLKGINNE